MMKGLIEALNTELDFTSDEISEVLWLALHMQAIEPSTEELLGTEESEQIDQSALSDSSKENNANIDSKASETPESEIPDLQENEPRTKPDDNANNLESSAPSSANIHPRSSGDDNSNTSSGELLFPTPDAPSLSQPLDLAKALRPLMRRVASLNHQTLDEEATIQRIAEERVWIPVLKPDLELWLSLDLVVDESISMLIWRDTVKEIIRLVKRYGVFQDVRVWGLRDSSEGQKQPLHIRLGIGGVSDRQSFRSHKELIDASGRRLILVVSDCISPKWHDGSVVEVLQSWTENGPMAILQMMPHHLWDRTGLGLAETVHFAGLTPGIANKKLRVQKISPLDDVDLETGIRVPVLTLEPETCQTWAQMLAGKGGVWSTGVVFEPQLYVADEEEEEEEEPWINFDSALNHSNNQSVNEDTARVNDFWHSASPQAKRLVSLLASAPVISLPIIRVLQAAIPDLNNYRQVVVAEVLLGGLLKPSSPQVISPDTDPNLIQYKFFGNTREVLLKSSSGNDSINVVDIVSKFIASRAGWSLQRFAATLKNPQHSHDEATGVDIQHFASVTSQILKRLGGDFARFAEELERNTSSEDEKISADQISPLDNSLGESEGQAEYRQPLSKSDNFYAILIGIDHYSPSLFYSSLQGCVRDVDLVDSYLKRALSLPSENICKLTAPNSDDASLQDRRTNRGELSPTYRNIVETFKIVTETAKAGDQIYIHYSGHGGRATTIYPDLKGDGQFDEALVPTDFNEPDGHYLRDVELATLLKRMTDKGLIVTVILDTSFSSGRNRESTSYGIRSGREFDGTDQLTDSLVADREELAANWLALTTKRASAPFHRIIPSSQDCIFLAACRPTEQAYEYAPLSGAHYGALTYWLIDTLRSNGATGLTYRLLYERIRDKIQSRFPNQMPMLEGEEDRLIFGSDVKAISYTATVISSDLEKQEVTLDVGLSEGISQGYKFSLYPVGSDFSDVDEKLGIVEVTQLQASTCKAKILPVEVTGLDLTFQLSAANITSLPGIPAVVESMGTHVSLKRWVRLVGKAVGEEESELPIDLVNKQSSALNKVRQALKGNDRLAEATEKQKAHYYVAVGRDGTYEIGIAIPLWNLRPFLSINDADAAQTVVNRLVHLSKYQSVQELDNRSSDLGRYLEVEFLTEDQQPFDNPYDIEMVSGDLAYLRIANNHSFPLNVTVLNLEATWEISQIPVQGSREPFYTIEPGEETMTRLRFSLPSADWSDRLAVKESFKIFISLGPINSHLLSLPPLDGLAESGGWSNRGDGILTRGGGTLPRSGESLNRLLADISSDQPAQMQNSSTVVEHNQEWTTKQIYLTLVASPPSIEPDVTSPSVSTSSRKENRQFSEKSTSTASGKIPMRDMVVVIPGMFGSTLQKDGKDVWGSLWSVARNAIFDQDRFSSRLMLHSDDPNIEKLDDGIVATHLLQDTQIIPGLVKIDGYTSLIRMIMDDFDVVSGELHDDKPANLFPFPYDWRRDYRVAARKLKRRIDYHLQAWRENTGNEEAQVILIAHSSGGLVARYYAEVLEGWVNCRTLITIGTPHRGFLGALDYLANGRKVANIDMTSLFRSFTSTYQLLPIYKVVEFQGEYYRVTELENIPNLDQVKAIDARAFHHEIEDASQNNMENANYREHFSTIPFSGIGQPTFQSAVLTEDKLTLSQDLPFPGLEYFNDGDGSVPLVSSLPLLPNTKRAQNTFNEIHGSLQTNKLVLEKLRDILTKRQL